MADKAKQPASVSPTGRKFKDEENKMSKQSRELREGRAKLVADMQSLIPKDGQPLSAESRTKFEALDKEQDGLRVQIETIERAEKLELETRETQRPPEDQIRNVEKQPEERKVAAVKEFRDALMREKTYPLALKSMPEEQRRIVTSLEARYWQAMRASILKRATAEDRAVLSGELPEYRDMGVATGGAGGDFVPTGFVYKVEQAMLYYGDMLNVAEIMDTATGQPLPWPTDNDTAQTGELIAEGAAVSTQDVALGQLTFGAFKFSTKMVKVSLELLQDSAFDLEGYLANKFGIRLGRILNNKFTVGVGTTEPKGIITAATAGPTAVGSSGNTGGAETGGASVGSTDLVALEHSVDKDYRRGGKYMMHDFTLRSIKEVLDKFGRPLWKAGLNAADPDTINGYSYSINNDMAQIALNAKTIAFGQLNKYKVRRVKELAILKLVERFADFGQVAFIGFARYDGNLLDAGTHPVKFLVQAAA